MKALVLSAGKGERLRPLTDRVPKPLLEVGGRRLIEWHLLALAEAGIADVVINTAHLAEQFEPALGDGSKYGVSIQYSYEGAEPLETGGGICRALHLLGDDAFFVVNADIWTDYDFRKLPRELEGAQAHLVMVPNPLHHPAGDFHLGENGRLAELGDSKLTYAGIGVYRPALFREWCAARGFVAGDRFPLAPILRAAMQAERILGEFHAGCWFDIGTEERLKQAQVRGASLARVF